MAYELIIANKRTGQVFDVTNSVTTCSWTTERTGAAGKFTFTILKTPTLDFLEGDSVRFSLNGELQFFGWVFTKSKDRYGVIDVVCYDRIRYLKANASYSFYDQTASSMIVQIAEDLQIELGDIADTGYQLPSLIASDQCCLDTIQTALNQTLLNTGKIFFLYDNGTGLSLQEPVNMRTNIMIGDESYLGDYKYVTDIDKQTYNFVKLARPNDSTGRADTVIAQDSETMYKWGKLQLYKQVDESLNTAQMLEQAKQMLANYNRRRRTLSASSLGVPGLRAGQMVFMKVDNLGDINLNQWMLINKMTHTYENGFHTMDFDLLEI